VNVKLGHWWQNTLIYKLFHVIRAWWSRTRLDIRAIRRTIRWDIRIWIIFGAFVLFELFGLVLFDARGDLVLVWFCEKVLFGFLLFQILKHYAKLKNSVVQMAEGDMNVQIDTKGMPLDFEEHGEALNKISSGMTTAVTERIKSERMKTELITNVSHDIKTPLTSIINYVDLLQKEQIENGKAKEYLEVLDRQAKRLKKLIEDLIEASKAATGNIKFQMESVNARMILNQSIGEFEERLEQNDITVVSKVPEEDVYVWADNRYLWRVFDNLMNNIVKYAQPGTRAYVDMIKADGTITFTFRNTSKNELNISAEELMERFVRGDASRNTEGNGLGLSIARSLTESMDGKMDLAIDGDLFKVILTFKAQ
jgi:signal transduction histidine kinase